MPVTQLQRLDDLIPTRPPAGQELLLQVHMESWCGHIKKYHGQDKLFNSIYPLIYVI